MLYFFIFLILAATAGILFLVFRRRLFGERSFSFGFFCGIGESYWIQRIKRSPQSPRLYKNLAKWYLRNKKEKDAIQALEYAIKLDPEDRGAKIELEKIKNKPA